ncbi:hypothetical protein, partial [Enterobacter hormaechei]|uniref:hypothetical protein n=1 Tax=Enterobacter hormaechei TaxID=158836 RepID=UPI002040346F
MLQRKTLLRVCCRRTPHVNAGPAVLRDELRLRRHLRGGLLHRLLDALQQGAQIGVAHCPRQ